MKHWNKVLLFTVATVLAAVFISCKPVTGDTQGGGGITHQEEAIHQEMGSIYQGLLLNL